MSNLTLACRRTSLALCLAGGLTWLAAPGLAKEPAVEFLRALQDQGYGEMAVAYLDQLQTARRLPPELTETWDLELSRSYRISLGEAFNAAEAADRLAKAQSHLDKFLKEHPNHAEVARAMESWGDIAVDRGLTRVRQAATVRDKGQKEALLAQARADFEEARPRFADATERYEQDFKKLKAGQTPAKGRGKAAASQSKKQRQADAAVADTEIAWLECRFKLGKVDYYVAETYSDPKSPERKAAFTAAAKVFDAVFQAYRESVVGLHAHMWHGRVADAMGDDLLAMDIYDEVLATSPEGRDRETALDPLFAQVQYHRFLVQKRKDGIDKFLPEAEDWIDAHKRWTKLDGYQGIKLEIARAQLELAAKATGNKKRDLTRTALASLFELTKGRGEHQHEAILLRRQHTGSDPQDLSTIKSFDEALALGESAVTDLDWAAAVAAMQKALELKSTAKDPKQVAGLPARLEAARYQLAASQLATEKYEDCLATAEQIVRDQPDGPLAPRASALAVSSALALYAQAQDKPAALKRLEKTAHDLLDRWPDKAEADDARIALGQAALVRGDLVGALETFEHVNPRSQRHSAALFLAGQTHWRRYLANRSKPTADRQTALAQLTASLAEQRKDAEQGKPLSHQTIETQLLLAEVELEAGRVQEAAELVTPLVASLHAEKPQPLDNLHLRMFVAAVRADLALGQAAKAAEAANLLVELGPDEPPIDAVLDSILKMFGLRWNESEAAVIEARSAADGARRATAEATAKQSKDQLAQLLAKLAPRKHHALPALIYIADTSAELGETDRAGQLYQAILQQADADPAFKQANAAALTRIQSRLVGLLRQKGQFAEGLAEVDKLIAAHPNALEPKMEKGRLLQGWAETDPSHFNEAVSHWTMLRTRLAKVAKKPPEYYEVVYNAANCLFAESMKSRNQQKALQAEQLLNATLVLSPHLSGPEMVARYKELLGKARQLQGRPTSTSRQP